jgi:hypothetical protein
MPGHPRHRSTNGAAALRRLSAGVALLMLLAAPPAVLLTLVGNPMQVPASLRSLDALTTQVDDQTVLWLLGTVVWLLWLHLLGSLTVEALRQTRGSHLRMPLPGLLFGANTLLASHLIATLLLTSQPGHGAGHVTGLTPAQPRAAASVTGVATVGRLQPAPERRGLTAAPASLDQPAVTPSKSEVPAGIECRVLPPHGRHHDTLWDIAERHLGDGTRWRDIYALNDGRLMPDGQRLTRASLIRPGWILRLPAEARALAVDTVAVLEVPGPDPAQDRPVTPATSTPGHGDRTQPAPGAHAVPAQPDTKRLPSHPDTHAETHAETRADSHADTDAGMDHDPSRDLPAAPPFAQQPGLPSSGQAAGGAAASPRPKAPSVTATTPSSGDPDSGPQRGTNTDADADSDVLTELTAGLGTLSVAALGLLAAVTRRRKVAARRRPPGVRPARPAPEVLDAESRLRSDARQADIAATVRLALLVTAPHAPHTRVQAVWEHPDGGIEIVLTDHDREAAAPAPFTATARGWLLPPQGQRYLFAVRQDGTRRQDRDLRIQRELQKAPDPFPLLLPVGEQDGSGCLVNLELIGLISVCPPDPHSSDNQSSNESDNESDSRSDDEGQSSSGDQPVDSGSPLWQMMAAWVQALAGAPWAERTRTYIPPAWADLAIGHEDVIPVDLHEPGDAYRPQPLSTRDRSDICDYPSHEAARRADAGDVAYDRVELAIGYPSGDLPSWLLSAAADPLDPNVVLLPHHHPEAQAWTWHTDGTLRIPGIAERIRPLRLDPAQHALILRLLEHAQDPPQAAPDDPHRAELDAASPPLPTGQTGETTGDNQEELRSASAAPNAAAPPQVIDLTSLAHPGQPTPLADATPETAADPRPANADDQQPVPAPAANGSDLPNDGPVDTSSAVRSGPVEVGILGPLQISGTDGHPPRQQALEILVYLAMHRQPVKLRTMAEAIWPNRSYHERTVQNRAGDLRLWLHRERVEKVDAGRWQVTDLVVTDWQRLRALAGGSPAQQLAALTLVRGIPFADLRLDWYHLEGQYAEIEATIVDLALRVGQRALKLGDYDTASVAGRAGLRGCPYDERLYRLGIQAAAARGATAEVRQLRNQLAWILEEEIEPDDTIQPATTELYQQLRDQEDLRRRRQQRRG